MLFRFNQWRMFLFIFIFSIIFSYLVLSLDVGTTNIKGVVVSDNLPTGTGTSASVNYTIALNGSYVPYTGANANVNLGSYNFTTTGIGTFGNLNITNGSVADFNPQTNIIQSLGSSVKRWLKGWFKDLDVSGTTSTKNMTLNGGAVNWSVYISTDGNLTFKKI